MKGNFGSMLTIDFEITDLEQLNDKEFITDWLKVLVSDIKMEIHQIDGPVSRPAILIDTWAAKTMPHTAGTSATLLLTSSSLSFHTAKDMHDPSKGVGYLDIFSCSDITYEMVYNNIKEHWDNPVIKRWMLIDR